MPRLALLVFPELLFALTLLFPLTLLLLLALLFLLAPLLLLLALLLFLLLALLLLLPTLLFLLATLLFLLAPLLLLLLTLALLLLPLVPRLTLPALALPPRPPLPARLVHVQLANLSKALVLLAVALEVSVGSVTAGVALLGAARTGLVVADRNVGTGLGAALVVGVDALGDVTREDSVFLGVVDGDGRHRGEDESHGEAGEDMFGDHFGFVGLVVAKMKWIVLMDDETEGWIVGPLSIQYLRGISYQSLESPSMAATNHLQIIRKGRYHGHCVFHCVSEGSPDLLTSTWSIDLSLTITNMCILNTKSS